MLILCKLALSISSQLKENNKFFYFSKLYKIFAKIAIKLFVSHSGDIIFLLKLQSGVMSQVSLGSGIQFDLGSSVFS